ncbi:MAG: hypothetical protein INQ03_25870 [Candidatus Heimdallarchaeota archaeon]|nr:hypothetical protein [Candidatus Heimdallarchaeota archaeon]
MRLDWFLISLVPPRLLSQIWMIWQFSELLILTDQQHTLSVENINGLIVSLSWDSELIIHK